MNDQQYEMVQEIGRRKGISFDAAADHFIIHGTGETARRESERDAWNAQVEADKATKRRAKGKW